MILPPSFYQHQDVIHVSQQLLGKFLCTFIGGELTSGMIIETEAYRGPEDRASHAFGNRRTKRTEVMFRQGGVCYVYLCYGLHALFNVITNTLDIPHAVLIRAIKPVDGIECMLKRRKQTSLNERLTSGPGALTQALGITVTHTGLPLSGPQIWIEDRGVKIDPKSILASPRVGVDYAKEDAFLPWRFRIKGHKQTIFQMVCDEPWFSFIRDGIKPVEGRKNSPKYQKIQVNDLIDFSNGKEHFRTIVTEIRSYPSLEAYLNDVTVQKALPNVSSFEDAIKIYHQWSTPEEIQMHGFLGIFVKILTARLLH